MVDSPFLDAVYESLMVRSGFVPSRLYHRRVQFSSGVFRMYRRLWVKVSLSLRRSFACRQSVSVNDCSGAVFSDIIRVSCSHDSGYMLF